MIEIESKEGMAWKLEKIVVVTTEGETTAVENRYLPELGKAVLDGKPFVVDFGKDSMPMMAVKSSNLGHIGWFNDSLAVTFKGKDGFTMYGYENVDADVYLKLMEAESIGKAFNAMKSALGDFVKYF